MEFGSDLFSEDENFFQEQEERSRIEAIRDEFIAAARRAGWEGKLEEIKSDQGAFGEILDETLAILSGAGVDVDSLDILKALSDFGDSLDEGGGGSGGPGVREPKRPLLNDDSGAIELTLPNEANLALL